MGKAHLAAAFSGPLLGHEEHVGDVDISPTTAGVDDESLRPVCRELREMGHGDDWSVAVTARVRARDEPVLPRFADDESPPVATVVEATRSGNYWTRVGGTPPEDLPSDPDWIGVFVVTTAVPSPAAAVERGRRVLATAVPMSIEDIRPVPRSARIGTVRVALPVPPEHAKAVEETLRRLTDIVDERATAPYPMVDTTQWAHLGFVPTGHVETVSLRSRPGQGPTLEASYSSPGSATAPPLSSGSQVVERLRRKIAAVAAWSLPLDDLRSHAGAHADAEVAGVDSDESGGPVPRDVMWTRVPPAPPALRHAAGGNDAPR